jgi:hypothetical protein
MRNRVSVVVALLVLFALLMGCPANQTGTSKPGDSILVSAEMTKTVAEDTLYYARVYYNLGKINEAQFKSVKDAYDILYVAQGQMIDARIAFLQMPTDATKEQKYKAMMAQVMIAQQKLIQLAFQLGIVKEEGTVIPIR